MQYKKTKMVEKGNGINPSTNKIQIKGNKKENIIAIILLS